MKTGYIKTHRSIQDCWIWNCDKYDKAHAWLDLLLDANHHDVKMLIDSKPTIVKRGCLFTSKLNLAAKWKWDRKTVTSFLSILENDGMITQERYQHGTMITIVNYSRYQQSADNEMDTTTDNALDIGADIGTDINKNDKNVKNNITPPIIPPYDGRVGFEFYGTFKNVELKPAELRKLQMDFGEDETQSAIDDLSCKLMDGSTESNAHYATLTYWLANRRKKKLREKENQPKGRDLIGNDDEFITDNTYQQ
jgi:DNA-binding transcriptional regulator YhcF (GntR family)